MTEMKKSSQSAQIMSPGRWTGNKLFLRVAREDIGQDKMKTCVRIRYLPNTTRT